MNFLGDHIMATTCPKAIMHFKLWSKINIKINYEI